MVTTEELLKLLKEIAEERIPFNKVLGLTVQTMDEEHMQVKFDMRDELVGNFMRGNLHGGVISSVLDLGRLVTKSGSPRGSGLESSR